MQLTKNLKSISVPLFVGACLFIFTFFLFIGTYIPFEYRGYLSFYEQTQQSELKSIQQKTETAFSTMDSLLGLTSARIAASQNDLKRIQNILVSTPHLVTLEKLPSIQSIAYYIVSKPYRKISRLGVTSLASLPLTLSAFKTKEVLVFQEDAIISRIAVFDEHEALKGVLEITIMPSDFTAFLGALKALSLLPRAGSQDHSFQRLQKEPFAIYAKSPDFFWQFVLEHQNRYAIFFCYTLVIFSLFLLCVGYFYWYFQKIYGNTITKSAEKIEELEEKLGVSEQKYKTCWTSFQEYKKIHANLNHEKREQSLHICKALEIVVQGVKGTKLHYSSAQQFELLQTSLKFAHFLSEGTVAQQRQEKIDINHLLGAISALFAEKIYKSNVILNITCPDDLFFYGDPLFTELILVNIIGKAIYRLSKNGKVLITILDQEETIFFELKDRVDPLKTIQNLSAAIKLFNEVFRGDKKNGYQARTHLALGKVHAFNKDYTKALKSYRFSEEIYNTVLKEYKIDDVSDLYKEVALLGIAMKDDGLTHKYLKAHINTFGHSHPRTQEILQVMDKKGLIIPF